MNRDIAFKEIAVVIQGGVSDKYTLEVLQSIKKHLPGSFIILSTWEGTKEIKGVDLQINNTDPGATILNKEGQLNNINRQIVSTINGLKEAIRLGYNYALKIRTDTKLTSCNFKQYFGKFDFRWNQFKLFEERIVICNKYVRPSIIFPFHISDWALFGKSTDLFNLFDIPPEPSLYTDWFRHNPLTAEHKTHIFKDFRHRYCAEQYIWTKCLSKKFNIKFEHMFDFSNDNTTISDLALSNNFVVLSDNQFGIKYLKHKTNSDFCIDFQDWLNLYSMKSDDEYHENLNGEDLTVAAIRRCKTRIYDLRRKVQCKVSLAKNIRRLLIANIRLFFIRTVSHHLNVIIEKKRFKILFHNIPITNWIAKSQDRIELFSSTKKTTPLPKFDKSFNRYVVWELATGETTLFAQNIQTISSTPDSTLFIFLRESAKQVFDLITDNKYHSVLASAVGLKRQPLPYLSYSDGKEIKYLLPDSFWNWFWNTKKTFLSAVSEKYGIEAGIISKFEKDERLVSLLQKKLETHGIDPNNFVILSPEANSIDGLSDLFWVHLAKKLRENKIDIVINSHSQSLMLPGSVSFNLSLADLLQLSIMAKRVYMLRSGLCEFLSQSGTPLTVFYPSKTRLPNFFENYSCEQYLTYSKITEHIVENDRCDIYI